MHAGVLYDTMYLLVSPISTNYIINIGEDLYKLLPSLLSDPLSFIVVHVYM